MESNEITCSSKLSKRQIQAFPYILSSPSYEEAARAAKISPKQIYEWLKNPTFRQELKRQRTDIFCDALTVLKVNTQKAIQTLISLLDDQDPRIRLLASEKILFNAFKGIEFLDLEERIGALESIAEKASKNKGLQRAVP
ncbi:MAG: hypothetical protein V4489_02915 [Chlamydiota bacterium]